MGKLLLDEQPLQVLPCLATEIGLNEAIALQQLHWVLQNPKMGKEVDGKKYVHMSYAEWRTGHFPFWSEATIQRTFSALEEMNLIESRNDLNALQIDRTKWYWIDPQAIARLEKSLETNEKVTEHKEVIDGHSKMKDGHRKMKFPSSQDERTIPDTSSADTSTTTTTVVADDFSEKKKTKPEKPFDEKAALTFRLYQHIISPNFSPLMAEKIRADIEDVPMRVISWAFEQAELHNVKHWKYVLAVIDSARANGWQLKDKAAREDEQKPVIYRAEEWVKIFSQPQESVEQTFVRLKKQGDVPPDAVLRRIPKHGTTYEGGHPPSS